MERWGTFHNEINMHGVAYFHVIETAKTGKVFAKLKADFFFQIENNLGFST